jgi:hypothetical protein
VTLSDSLTVFVGESAILTTANVTMALSGRVKLNSSAVANTLPSSSPPEVIPWNITYLPVIVVEITKFTV